jgi:hypothetical protein
MDGAVQLMLLGIEKWALRTDGEGGVSEPHAASSSAAAILQTQGLFVDSFTFT